MPTVMATSQPTIPTLVDVVNSIHNFHQNQHSSWTNKSGSSWRLV